MILEHALATEIKKTNIFSTNARNSRRRLTKLSISKYILKLLSSKFMAPRIKRLSCNMRNRNRFAEPISVRIGIGIVCEFHNLQIGIGIIFVT